MPHIRVLLGHQFGRVYSLKPSTTSIGREPSSDIVLPPDSPASRRHAEISCSEGEWLIRDLGSSNGTQINGTPIAQTSLDHSDEIVVGENVMVFEYSDRRTAETEEAASRAIPKNPGGLQNDPHIISLVRSIPAKMALLEDAFFANTAPRAALMRQLVMTTLTGSDAVVFGIDDFALPSTIRQVAQTTRNDIPWNGGPPVSFADGQPAFAIEARSAVREGETIPDPEKFLPHGEIGILRTTLHDFHIPESLVQTAVRIVCATRPESRHASEAVKQYVSSGAAPDSAFHLLAAAKARAILKGRTHMDLADMEKVAAMTLRHRILPNAAGRKAGIAVDSLIAATVTSALEAA